MQILDDYLRDCHQWVCNAAGDPEVPDFHRDALANVAKKIAYVHKIVHKYRNQFPGGPV
jgi:hypothetical protein